MNTQWTPTLIVRRRQRMSWLISIISTAFAALLILILLSILISLAYHGLSGISLHVFTRSMGPPGSHSGLGNAILGSFIQTFVAMIFVAPLGVLCGIYLAEYSDKFPRFTALVSFSSDFLMSVPSILVGLFIYELLVAPFKSFSGFSGSVALAVLALPIIVRTTKDMLELVPLPLKEAGVALGASYSRVVISLCLRAAKNGLLTGLLLAMARMGGETAPLLFTSFGNQDWSFNMSHPMASLPLAVYQYAGSSYEDWLQLSWTGAFIITVAVLSINILVRLISRNH